MKTLRALAILFLTFISANAFAVGPYGINVGETTKIELTKNYPAKAAGMSEWTGGPVYSIDPHNFTTEGLSKVTVILNDSDVVVAVILQLPKSKFEAHNKHAADTYELISKDIPFVGDRLAKYKSGETQIWLDAPHMSFDMKVMFLHDTFLNAFQKGSQAK